MYVKSCRILTGILVTLALAWLGQAGVHGQAAEPRGKVRAVDMPSLQVMLNAALANNPEIRAAQARLKEAEAELHKARLSVAQTIIAFREKWDAAKLAVVRAEQELRELTRLRTLADKGLVAKSKLIDVEIAARKLERAKSKVTEIKAELPFLLGGPLGAKDDDDKNTVNDAAKNNAALLPLARQITALTLKAHQGGEVDQERVYVWSRRLMQAEQAAAKTAAGRRAAVEAHASRMKSLLKSAEQLYKAGQTGQFQVLAAQYYAKEAQRLLAGAQAP